MHCSVSCSKILLSPAAKINNSRNPKMETYKHVCNHKIIFQALYLEQDVYNVAVMHGATVIGCGPRKISEAKTFSSEKQCTISESRHFSTALREVSKYLGKGRPSQTRGYGTCVRTSVCLSVTTSGGMFISTLKLRYEHLYSGILLNF